MTELTSVNSANLDAVGYDDLTEELVVRFKNGSEYTYSNVKPHVFDDLMNSTSKGRFFSQNIKNVYSSK